MNNYQLAKRPFTCRQRPLPEIKREQQPYQSENNTPAKDAAYIQPPVFVSTLTPGPPQLLSFQHNNMQQPTYSPNYMPQPLPTPPLAAQSVCTGPPLQTEDPTYYVVKGPHSTTLPLPVTTTMTTTMANMAPSHFYYCPYSNMEQDTRSSATMTTTLQPGYIDSGSTVNASTSVGYYTPQLYNVLLQPYPLPSISQSPQPYFQTSPQVLAQSQAPPNIPPQPRQRFRYSQQEPEPHQYLQLQPMISGQVQNVETSDPTKGMANLQTSLSPTPISIPTPVMSEDSQVQLGMASIARKEHRTNSNRSGTGCSGASRMDDIRWVTKKTLKPWSKKEDKLLLSLKSIDHLNWCQIASHFPDRTTNGCQFRWRRLVSKAKTDKRE